MTALVSSGRTGTPQELQVAVGLGLVAIGAMLLWYRRDLYWAYQWAVRYPNHGFVYVMIQFVAPVVLVVGGVALIAALALSH